MPGWKRSRTVRKTVRRRVRRRMMGPRPRIFRPRFGNQTALVKRTFWHSNWTLGTASTSDFWKYFTVALTSLPSSAELTSLWDRFRIAGVRVTFRPRYTGFGGENTTDTTLPGITNQAGNYVHIINDPYSNLTPTGTYNTTTLNAFLENGNVKTYQGMKPFSFYVKPAIDRYLGGASSASRIRSPWMLTTAANQQHSLFHAFQQDVNMTGTSGQSFDIFMTMYVQLRGLK